MKKENKTRADRLKRIEKQLPPYIRYDKARGGLFNHNTGLPEYMDGDLIEYVKDGSSGLKWYRGHVAGYTNNQFVPTREHGMAVLDIRDVQSITLIKKGE